MDMKNVNRRECTLESSHPQSAEKLPLENAKYPRIFKTITISDEIEAHFDLI